MKIIDISLPISSSTPVWPGQPSVVIEPHATFEKNGARVSKLSFSSHAGTHIDAPSHFLKDGKTIDQMSLAAFIGPARVLDLTGLTGEITATDLEPFDLQKGERILFKTTNSRRLLESEFYIDYVSLSESGANYLVDRGVILVGIDYLGIEKKGNQGHPVHNILLSNDVVIVEGLYLENVSAGNYELICLPLNIKACDGAPARAILVGK